LHWPTGANGKGALLTGDIITVVQDRRYVSFLRSYPNLIPLGASAIRRIVERIDQLFSDIEEGERALERALTRESVLVLPTGAYELEPGFEYTYRASDALQIVTVSGVPQVARQDVKQDRLETRLTLRAGLPHASHVEIRLPYVLLRDDRSTADRFGQTVHESGVGDLLLKVSYTILEERDFVPEIAPYVKIKFPTADSDRGLGTGEFDETVGVDLSKRLIGGLFGFVTLSYTFVGDPPGTDFRNSFGWSVGPAYSIGPLSVFASLDGSTAISPGQADPLEVRVGAEYRLTRALKFTGAVTRGLSNGSADWGGSAGFLLRF